MIAIIIYCFFEKDRHWTQTLTDIVKGKEQGHDQGHVQRSVPPPNTTYHVPNVPYMSNMPNVPYMSNVPNVPYPATALPFYRDQRIPFEMYQMVGYVFNQRQSNDMFRLMGRQYAPAKYEYYVIHPYNDIKIPISVKNDWELNTGDHIHIPGFHDPYIVKIYDDDEL